MAPPLSTIREIIHFHYGIVPEIVLPINLGVMTYKYEFAFNYKPYIIRIYPKSREYIGAREFDILKLGKQFNCKVPNVCFNNTYEKFTYIIYEKLEGESLSLHFNNLKINEQENICAQIAENFFSLSRIQFEKFGDIIKNNIWYNEWKDFLLASILDGKNSLIGNDFFKTIDTEKLFVNLYKILDKLRVDRPLLVWTDFSQENIIIQNNTLTGFVDFESCLAGDPRMAFGYLFAREGNSNFYLNIKHFLQKKINFTDSEIAFYALIRIIRIIKYTNSSLPNGDKREGLHKYFRGLRDSIDIINRNS